MPLRTYIICALLTALPNLSLRGEQSIVPIEVCESPDYALAANFLQHYHALLVVQQTEAVSDTIRRVKEDGFRYIKGNDSALKSLKSADNFNIEFNNGFYRTQWISHGNIVVDCTFPANIGLLTFSSKKDLEQKMLAALQKAKSEGTPTIPMPQYGRSELTHMEYSDLYVLDHGFYLIPRLGHYVVFSPDSEAADSCSLLIDRGKYPLESLANIMLTGYAPNPITAIVKLNQYGYKSCEIALPFASLFSYLSSEGSTPYWGVEQYNGEDVKGLYLWVNTAGGYAHLLTVSIPVSALNECSDMSVRMHCYIRLDNVKTLFEEFPEL